MFSRALSVRSSQVAKSLLTSPRAFAAIPSVSRRQEFARGFKSSVPLKNLTKEEDAPGPSAIIEKYGSLTFWGMLASIVITKEIFIIDAEFMLACEAGAFALTAYVLTGDSIEKMSKEEDQKTTDKFNDANDFMLAMLAQYKMVQQTNQGKPEVLAEYLGEFKEAITKNAEFQSVLPKHAARTQVLAALESVKSKEEHAASEEWQEKVEAAVSNVTAAFTIDNAQLQQDMLAMSIGSMGFEDPSTENDPVKALFVKEFEEDEA